MSRIVVSVMPFAGHVTPVLGVAAELVRRGHEVVAYTGAKYAPRFLGVGAGWEPWRQAPDFDDADLAARFPQVGKGTGTQAAGRPVVHVSQGTLHVDPGQLIRPAIAGLSGSDALVVVSTGRDAGNRLGDLPANVRVAPFLPYDRLLPLVDVMVGNAGWSSVLAAVAAGVPLVVGGADLDKPEVARRVAWSGVGVDLRTGRPRPSRIRTAVDRVLADPGMRATARRLAADLAAAGGSVRAADLVEQVLLGRAPA